MHRLETLGTVSLRGPDGAELRGVLAQPKRTALLVYLALEAHGRFLPRDPVLALFWPEARDRQARHALRSSLHFLRRELGARTLPSRGHDVGVADEALWCDANAFEAALDAGHAADALALYRGEFLTGFSVFESSPELDQWLDETRDRLRRKAAKAAWALADADASRGNTQGAAHWARLAASRAPDDEGAIRRLMSLLDHAGDRAGAVRVYDQFARRLATEYEVEPAAETQAMVALVRTRISPYEPPSAAADARARDAAAVQLSALPLEAPEQPEIASIGRRSALVRRAFVRRARALAISAGVTIALVPGALLFVARRTGWTASGTAALAVGRIEQHQGTDSSTARVLPDLLATDLARVRGLDVVSPGRIYELLTQLGTTAATPGGLARAATAAQATDLLEGVLYHRGGDTLRLDLRRVDPVTGVVRQSYTVQATDPFALADSATEAVATELGLAPPARRLADVTTTSLVARRLHDEGLRSYYQNDARTAQRLFADALAEESTFAIAAYDKTMSDAALSDGVAFRADLALAERMSAHASERERLLIAYGWESNRGSAVPLAIAESLATLYPNEPDGELALGSVLASEGEFLAAVPHLQRVESTDSLAMLGRTPRCLACEAHYRLLSAYIASDSLAAAERAARAWTLRYPRSALAWERLAYVLDRKGQLEAAEQALRRGTELGSGPTDDAVQRAGFRIRAGDFDTADRILTERVRSGSRVARTEGLWWLAISLRTQGRLADALSVARRYRETQLNAHGDDATTRALAAVPLAQVQLELHHAREAAALFDSAAHFPFERGWDAPQGVIARHLVWHHTLAAMAHFAAGDTIAVAALADSVRHEGHESSYGRDPRLYLYLRALVEVAGGRDAEAATELRAAMFSPTEGLTRINVELAHALLRLRQPRGAIAVLRPALHGPIESGNLYVTLTEVHELLAQAFDAAGDADSARVHYRWVDRGWRSADGLFAPRWTAAHRRLVALDAQEHVRGGHR